MKNFEAPRTIPVWSRYFLDLAKLARSRSKDPHTQVGSIIVNAHNNPISTGYNDLPRGVKHLPERYERPAKYLWTEHAERNAIYNAARHGIKLDGSSIFCLYVPCADCARAIIQSGIVHVVIDKEYFDKYKSAKEVSIVSLEMFAEAGVTYEVI